MEPREKIQLPVGENQFSLNKQSAHICAPSICETGYAKKPIAQFPITFFYRERRVDFHSLTADAQKCLRQQTEIQIDKNEIECSTAITRRVTEKYLFT